MEFIDIYSCIAKCYPIGMDRYNPLYQQYAGYQSLIKMIENKVSPELYQNKWKPFVKSFKQELPEIINAVSESMLLDACYTGELTLKKENIKSLLYKQKLVFHLSVIESFFTIYGKTEVVISDEETKGRFLNFDPIITVSPIRIYERYFNHVKAKIRDIYPESSFVPFVFLKQRVNGLTIDTSDLKENQYSSVFQALFLGENVTDYKIEGDLFYH